MKLVQKLYKVFFKWIAPMTRGVTDKTYNWKKKGSGRREEEEEEMEERRGGADFERMLSFHKFSI